MTSLCVGCGKQTSNLIETCGKLVCYRCMERLDSALYKIAVIRAMEAKRPAMVRDLSADRKSG